MAFKILVINPGSTSTKVALFEDKNSVCEENISHSNEQLKQFPTLWDQFDFRKKAVLDFLEKNDVSISLLSAVAGRGGLIRSIPGGTYTVNEQMVADAKAGLQGVHAANLGCAIAKSIADPAEISAYVVDPISVDEFEPLARYSGHPLIERRALSHTLNIHAVGRMAAEKLNVNYLNSNFVIAHLGGGISICPLKNGRIIDVNDASAAGPFSPERSGGLPLMQFIELCYSGEYDQNQMQKMVMGEGGMAAYLKTVNAAEIEERIKLRDAQAEEVYEAMAYQIAKEIGAMATVISGNVRAIIISGGLAKSKIIVNWIFERVKFIAQVLVMPGEFEMEALANGVLRVLRGKEDAKMY
ncbi:butyrate kinase [candidate division KSB1 bacterium]|nr:butyrate kinase [candidate division KSB1 bacterium]